MFHIFNVKIRAKKYLPSRNIDYLYTSIYNVETKHEFESNSTNLNPII